MSCKLFKKTYEQLIQEDIEWLEENTDDCLEKDHIIQVLKASVNLLYPEGD